MNTLRIVMEALRTAAAVIAAIVLLSHSPVSLGDSVVTAEPKRDDPNFVPGPHTIDATTATDLFIFQLFAYKEACKALKISCKDIPPPIVGYAVLNRYGQFDIGTRTVLVNMQVMGSQFATTVIFHETIHYLQSKTRPGVTGITPEQLCKDEKVAHDLTEKFAKEFGLAQGDHRINPWSEAKEYYVQCASKKFLEGIPIYKITPDGRIVPQ